MRTEKCEREREKERERGMREVVTLEWDNWHVNKWEERDKGVGKFCHFHVIRDF